MANDVKLQEGHPVDENLRPLKVGGKSTALETAQHGNGARVNGSLEVTGDISSANFTTGDITGVTAGDGLTGGGTGGDVSLAVGVDDSTIEIDSDALRVKDDGITYSKIQNVSATDRILGRDSASAGVIEEITPSNLRAMINVEDGSTADQSKSDIDGLAITTVGTIDTGTWEGTTVAVGQGGTGATSLTTDGVLFGNGTSAISAVDLSTNGNVIVGGSTPAVVTGANLAGSGLAATTGNGTLVLAVETLNQDTTGTAATVTGAAQSAITSLGTLTALTVDDVAINGKVITMTGSTGDTFTATVATDGVTTLATTDAGGAVAHLNIEADGHVEFNGCAAGFTQITETFSDDSIIGSGGTHDTHIDFRAGNKVYLAMTADVVTMNLIFPDISGNFLLQLRYDGDHDITNWKVWEHDSAAGATNAADGDTDVKWAGGSAPATTSGGYDIFTFYWDAENEVAFGVGSLGFAS